MRSHKVVAFGLICLLLPVNPGRSAEVSVVETVNFNGISMTMPPATPAVLLSYTMNLVANEIDHREVAGRLTRIEEKLNQVLFELKIIDQRLSSMQQLLKQMDTKLDALAALVDDQIGANALAELEVALDRLAVFQDQWVRDGAKEPLETAHRDLETACWKLTNHKQPKYFPAIGIAFLAERDLLSTLGYDQTSTTRSLDKFRQYFRDILSEPTLGSLEAPIAPTDPLPTVEAKLRARLSTTLPDPRSSISRPPFSGNSTMAQQCGAGAPANVTYPYSYFQWEAGPEDGYFVVTVGQVNRHVCYKAIPNSLWTTGGGLGAARDARGANWEIGSYFRVDGLIHVEQTRIVGGQLFYEATNINDCVSICMTCTIAGQPFETHPGPCGNFGVPADGHRPTVRAFAAAFGGVEPEESALATAFETQLATANELVGAIANIIGARREAARLLAAMGPRSIRSHTR